MGDGRRERETIDGSRETGERRETGDGSRETVVGRRETGDEGRRTREGRRETGDGRQGTGDGRRDGQMQSFARRSLTPSGESEVAALRPTLIVTSIIMLPYSAYSEFTNNVPLTPPAICP